MCWYHCSKPGGPGERAKELDGEIEHERSGFQSEEARGRNGEKGKYIYTVIASGYIPRGKWQWQRQRVVEGSENAERCKGERELFSERMRGWRKDFRVGSEGREEEEAKRRNPRERGRENAC